MLSEPDFLSLMSKAIDLAAEKSGIQRGAIYLQYFQDGSWGIVANVQAKRTRSGYTIPVRGDHDDDVVGVEARLAACVDSLVRRIHDGRVEGRYA